MKIKKTLLITLKLVLAAGLLGWVLSKAHWHDYIVANNGTSYISCGYDSQGKLLIAENAYSSATEAVDPTGGDYKPIVPGGSEYVHPGLKSILSTLSPWVLVMAAAIYLVGLLIVGVRWWLLMRMQKLDISLYDAMRFSFLGLFFNYVIPGTVGGDLVKAWYASKRTKHTAVLLVTIFVDRVTGIGAMALLAIILLTFVLLFGGVTVAQVKPALIAISIISAIIVAGMLFMFFPGLRKMLRIQKLFGRLSVAKHFEHAGNAIDKYRQRPMAMLGILVLALMIHVTVFGSIAIIGHYILPAIPFYRYYVYLPIIYIIGAVPVTPGGVGLIESMYVEFLAPTAAAVTGLFVVSMMARIIPIILSLPGLIVALKGPKIPDADKLEQQLEQSEVFEENKEEK